MIFIFPNLEGYLAAHLVLNHKVAVALEVNKDAA